MKKFVLVPFEQWDAKRKRHAEEKTGGENADEVNDNKPIPYATQRQTTSHRPLTSEDTTKPVENTSVKITDQERAASYASPNFSRQPGKKQSKKTNNKKRNKDKQLKKTNDKRGRRIRLHQQQNRHY